MAETNSKVDEIFTAKEQATMNVAWLCLKDAPVVDIKRLTELGGFKTEKTASNTWGVIKKKLATHAAGQGISFEKGGSNVDAKTASPKKRAKKTTDEDATPAKKRVVKKKTAVKVKTEDGSDDEQVEPEEE